MQERAVGGIGLNTDPQFGEHVALTLAGEPGLPFRCGSPRLLWAR